MWSPEVMLDRELGAANGPLDAIPMARPVVAGSGAPARRGCTASGPVPMPRPMQGKASRRRSYELRTQLRQLCYQPALVLQPTHTKIFRSATK
ncbi:hypothetical protein GCM10028796_12570 [Ramlibacter monticola]